MTVESTVNKARFLGSGSVGPFTFDFRFFSNSEIHVIKTPSSGFDTDLAESTDYTVSGAGTTTGGSITLTTALAIGESLTVYREIAVVQNTSIRNQSAFYPEIHETVFDKLTMMVQQITDIVKRSFKMPISTTVDYEFPSDDYANRLLGTDADGNPTFYSSGYSITVVAGSAASVSPSYSTADSGDVTVNLPASGEVLVTKTGHSANLVTLVPAGASTINGSPDYSLYLQGESVRLIFQTDTWYVI